jgi:hypothetical protein
VALVGPENEGEAEDEAGSPKAEFETRAGG